MSKEILVIGAGLVGQLIVKELAKEFKLCVVDINEEHLDRVRSFGVETCKGDILDPVFAAQCLENKSLVVNAVPGEIGFKVLKLLVEEGKRVVDIAFFEEDPFSLSSLAEERGALVIFDCGIAPGFSNIVIGEFLRRGKELESVEIYVGGLPQERKLPWEYTTVFSIKDVLAEYIRPARFRVKGEEVVENALSGLETIEVQGLGTLEAFLTDGLRSLLKTTTIPNIIEKTIRYPGHRDKLLLLRDSGFFSEEKKIVGKAEVSALDLTATVLKEAWGQAERDLLVMKIVLREFSGKENIVVVKDFYDEKEKDSSMSRCTGYTACSIVKWLEKNSQYVARGIVSPEELAREHPICQHTVQYLREKGIEIRGI
ncbi:MAG: saccharopine dehydrogenase [Candidatus Dadabacteria bacterium]|nr:MAG: saccharopine dehydrogenase [Candidatus Dadabacteria bacterium]